MLIVQWLQTNWLLVVFIACLLVGMNGGPKELIAKLKGIIPTSLPGSGATTYDAVDAAQLLCNYLPSDAAEQLRTLVSPYLLSMNHDKDE